MSKKIDIKGKTFNDFTVIDEIPNSRYVKCRCVCGSIRSVFKPALISDKHKSCGCRISIRDAATMKSYILSKIKIDKKGCWNWTGSLINGYGRVRVNNIIGVKGKKTYRVSRVSAALFTNFDLNSKMLVCHKCDNPSCVNPSHLFIGTHKDNMSDRQSKNRQAKGERSGIAKLTAYQVRKIRTLRIKHKFRVDRLAKMFNVHRDTIWMIAKKLTWKHLS